MPPTERRGRVHTSTVTVAVIDPETRFVGPWDNRRDADFEVQWFSGTGKGGQHRNKHQNSCRLIHKPTGTVETRQGRERVSNYNDAKAALLATLDAMGRDVASGALAVKRRAMVGSGQRGDKVRTIRVQADEAVDHRTSRRIRASEYLTGGMDKLW